jgi:DNA-binding MarR family transcriptional regulator
VRPRHLFRNLKRDAQIQNNVIDNVNYIVYDMNMSNIEESFEHMSHTGDEAHLLRDIVRTHQVLMAGLSRKVGMTSSRFALMRLLALADRDVGVADLARKLGINSAAVTRHVKEMEGERLVRRYADARDARRSYVKLSSKGLKLFEDVHSRTHELERALSAVISHEEMSTTVEALAKLRAFIEGLR